MEVKLFKTHPGRKFKLVGINDINCIYPHKYKVIFRDIETNIEYEEEIIPEYLRGNFILGNVYSSSGCNHKNQSSTKLFVKGLSVTSKYLKQLHECIQSNDNFAQDFYNQYCITYFTKKAIFLIPCYVIANRYYFISTDIKKALSDGSFKTLYYANEYNNVGYQIVNNTLSMHLKKTVKAENAPLIARMIVDKKARENFLFFFTQTSRHLDKNRNNPFKPIKMGFPFYEHDNFSINAHYLDLGNVFFTDKTKTALDDRNVVLLTHITNDTIPNMFTSYNFSYSSQDIEKNELKNDTNSTDKTIPKNNPGNTGIISTKNPSSSYSPHYRHNQVENTYEYTDFNITFREIIEKSHYTVYVEGDDDTPVDESFGKPESGKIKNKVREANISDDLQKEQFKISDFLVLINQFLKKYSISEYEISDEITLENFDSSKINKFFIDIDKRKPRKLIFGYFTYAKQIINFIEVEHNIFWRKNTWFVPSNRIFSESDVQQILNTYINKNQTQAKMIESSKTLGAQKIFTTMHDNIDTSKKDSIKNWCNNVHMGLKLCGLSMEILKK